MINAWEYALMQVQNNGQDQPTIADVLAIGARVEQIKNVGGIRHCNVYVGSHACPAPHQLNRLLVELFEALRDDQYEGDPIAFYKAFEEVHCFEDGNGRTGKVLLNWVNGSLLRPIFPPNNLWGRPIRNP